MSSVKNSLKVVAAIGLAQLSNQLPQVQAVKQQQQQDAMSSEYLSSTTSEQAFNQVFNMNKRHHKKHHHRREPRPSASEDVTLHETKTVTEEEDAERKTMDMIKEELSKEMGDDAPEADPQAAGFEAQASAPAVEPASIAQTSKPSEEETTINPKHEKQLHQQIRELNKMGHQFTEENPDAEVPGNFAAQRIFQEQEEARKQAEDEEKQEAEAAKRVHAQMTNTAKSLRGDPFGIDVRDQQDPVEMHHSAFATNEHEQTSPSFDSSPSYDASATHREVELLSSSLHKDKPKATFFKPIQDEQTAGLIAMAISHQMAKANGIESEDAPTSFAQATPSPFGFSQRLKEAASSTRTAIEEPPAPKLNISKEEFEEGQNLKPLSLSEQSQKDSVVQRTLNAMKAHHHAAAEEDEVDIHKTQSLFQPLLSGPSPQAAPVPMNPVKHAQLSDILERKIKAAKQAKELKMKKREDTPEIMKVKKMSEQEESDADIAAMDDVEERQKRAVARAQNGGIAPTSSEDNDGSLAEKKTSTDIIGPIQGFEDEDKAADEEKTSMSPQQLAVKNTLEKINTKRMHDHPEIARAIEQKKLEDEFDLSPESKHKGQVENKFVADKKDSGAGSFSKDLTNLEGINTKYQKPLEAEREKELAEKKAKDEWARAEEEDKIEKDKMITQQQEAMLSQKKHKEENGSYNYQIETSKLEADDEYMKPDQHHIAFSQQEHKSKKSASDILSKILKTQKSKPKEESNSFSIETSKLDDIDMDEDAPKKAKETKPIKMVQKKTAIKVMKKQAPKEDPYAFTVETTTASPDLMKALTEQPEDDEPKPIKQAKKGGLQGSKSASSFLKMKSASSAGATGKSHASAVATKDKLIKSITAKAIANQNLTQKKSFKMVSIAEKLKEIAAEKEKERNGGKMGDPYDLFSDAISNTFKADSDKANALNQGLNDITLKHAEPKKDILPGLVHDKDTQDKSISLAAQLGIKIEDHSKKSNKSLQEMIMQIFGPVQPALASLGHQNNATISIVINDEALDELSKNGVNMSFLDDKKNANSTHGAQGLSQKKKKTKRRVKVSSLMQAIKGSLVLKNKDLHKYQQMNNEMRDNEINISQLPKKKHHKKEKDGITDDYLKAVQYSIESQESEERDQHMSVVQKTIKLAKAAQAKKQKKANKIKMKLKQQAEEKHQALLEKLKKEEEEHEAQVRKEAQAKQSLHDSIIQKAIQNGKEQAPILAAKKKSEEEEFKAAQELKKINQKKEEQEHSDDLYKNAMNKGGENTELHSITQKLSSFTDMANSLKNSIDFDGDADKSETSNFLKSQAQDEAGDLKTQAKLNSKKAEELASQIVGKDPQNALKILEQQEKDDHINDVKLMPLKSKKDEIVAKAVYEAKENMKKISHPLAGFMMGEEGSSYAVQLNTTDVATPNNSKNSTGLIAHLQMEQKAEVQVHNETVKGAIVKFAKSMKLHNPEAAAAKSAATKVEEVKKDSAPAAKKTTEPTKDQKTTAVTPPKVEEKKEAKKQEKPAEKPTEVKKEDTKLAQLSPHFGTKESTASLVMKDLNKVDDEKKIQNLAEGTKKNDQQKPEKDSNWLKESFKTVKDFGKKVSGDFKKIFLAQSESQERNNQEKMFQYDTLQNQH